MLSDNKRTQNKGRKKIKWKPLILEATNL
jgi:hypothetical protein